MARDFSSNISAEHRPNPDQGVEFGQVRPGWRNPGLSIRNTGCKTVNRGSQGEHLHRQTLKDLRFMMDIGLFGDDFMIVLTLSPSESGTRTILKRSAVWWSAIHH
jgi:hypothetical protein